MTRDADTSTLEFPTTISINEIHTVPVRDEFRISISFLVGHQKVETKALIDSGAKGASFINSKFVQENQIPTKRLSRPIPIQNVDGTVNKAGEIERYLKVSMEVYGKTCEVTLLETSLGQETVILGYPWLRQENPNIDWKQHKLTWNTKTYHIKQIGLETFEHLVDDTLVIALIKGPNSEEAQNAWVMEKMSHSEKFAYEAEKAKEVKTKEEIVPRALHGFLDTVFTERQVGELPPRTKYDHAIEF